jgi:hypothetical protein
VVFKKKNIAIFIIFLFCLLSVFSCTKKYPKEEQLDLPKLNLSFKDSETFGLITKDEYIESKISITDIENSENNLNTFSAQIKGSGNSNFDFNKKNYHLKLKENLDLIGHGNKKNNYVLRAATWSGTDFGSNHLNFGEFNEKLLFEMSKSILNNYEYIVDFKTYDVYVNNTFHGVYNLFETIEDEKGSQDVEANYEIDNNAFLIELDS